MRGEGGSGTGHRMHVISARNEEARVASNARTSHYASLTWTCMCVCENVLAIMEKSEKEREIMIECVLR